MKAAPSYDKHVSNDEYSHMIEGITKGKEQEKASVTKAISTFNPVS